MSDLIVRRDIERAIHDALNPKGMSVHSGKAVVNADRLEYLLRAYDARCAEVERLTKENEFLRAYTGTSAKACVYCGLGADEQGKCARGLPGCARADDQLLCREVGVALERDELRAKFEVALRLLNAWATLDYEECEFNDSCCVAIDQHAFDEARDGLDELLNPPPKEGGA